MPLTAEQFLDEPAVAPVATRNQLTAAAFLDAPEPPGALTRFAPPRNNGALMPQPSFDGMAGDQFSAPSPEDRALFNRVRQTPLVNLPSMPELSDLPTVEPIPGYEDFIPPSLGAGVYNAMAPAVSSLTSPQNLAIMAATAGTGTLAQAGSVPAKVALTALGVGFGGVMAKETVEQVKQAREILQNPDATEQQKTEAVAAPIVSGVMSLAALAGAGRIAAGEAIPRLNQAYPEVFWRKSGLDAEQFAATYPSAVRRVAMNQGTEADIELVRDVNKAAQEAKVSKGDLARGRIVAENVEWEPRAIQKFLPESLKPERPAQGNISFHSAEEFLDAEPAPTRVAPPAAPGESPRLTASPDEAAPAATGTPVVPPAPVAEPMTPVAALAAAPVESLPPTTAVEPSVSAVAPVAVPEAPPAAKVTDTPEGPKIAPTASEDVRVSKLVDRKQFKVQREFLLDAAQKAMAAAPDEVTTINKVVIEVPGDGTFTIDNYKGALHRFIENIAGRFGKAFTVNPSDQGPTEQAHKVTSPFYQPQMENRAPKPAPIPQVKAKPMMEDLTKVAQMATSEDPDRYIINHVFSEDGFSVGTDGRRLYLVAGGGGKTAADITKLYPIKKKGDTQEKFPNWRQVIPGWVKVKGGKITTGKDAPTATLVLTAEAIKSLNQVMAVTSERSNSVKLYLLGSGKIGFSAASPDFGDYHSDGVKPDTDADTAMNPEQMRDAMVAARFAGHDTVKLYIKDDASPVVMIGGNTFASVTMPVRLSAGTKAAPAVEPATAPKPAAPAPVERSVTAAPVAPAQTPEPVMPTKAAIQKEEQLDLLQVQHGRAPVLARLNQKINELENLRAYVEKHEEFPPAVVEYYTKRLADIEARLDRVEKRKDELEEKSVSRDKAEDAELGVLTDQHDALYDMKETAEGDLKAVERDPTGDGMELIASRIKIYEERKTRIDAMRVKAALAGQMDDVSAGFTPRSNGRAAGLSVGTPNPGKFAQATPPADNPGFSQLPFQLPEMLAMIKIIMDGKIPRIVKSIRLHGGEALGVFRYREGQVDSGRIEVRADLFHYLSQAEKELLMKQAVAWATGMRDLNPGLNFHEAIKAKFQELVKAAEAEAMKRDPTRALYVIAHEFWHAIDFLPHGTLRRGNILGHLAAFKNYLHGYLDAHPGFMGEWTTHPTDSDIAKLRRKAEKELNDAVSEILETIKREVPVYSEIPITADHITSILKTAQRDEFPQLYDWFAGLDRANKAAVLRAAMKGIVDERAARFASRKQIGTKIVEETVTRRVGDEVTPEAIRKRFEELLRAELKSRGLVSQRDIKAELESTIAWWHGTEKMPAYFKTAVEMFAEAGAIFMNNPAALAKRAPTFYQTLMNYMQRRPEVQKAYEQVQADIQSGAIYKQRVGNLLESWKVDEASGLERELAGRKQGPNLRRLKDTFNLAFNKHQGPIQALAKRAPHSPESIKLLSALKDYLYRQTAVEGLARQINLRVEKPLAENNLNHDNLSEFMFHNRIVNGDAQQTANAQGWSPNTSAQRLEEMSAQLGPRRFGVLKAATESMRMIYEEGPLKLLQISHALKPELMAYIKQNIHYSPFMKAREAFNPLDEGTIAGMLDAAYGKEITARIFHRVGYLGDIQSPYVALVHKAESLTRFAYRQIALRSIRDYMQAHEPHLITEAPMHFNGRQMVPKIVHSDHVGTLLVMDAGVVRGYYVPLTIWETMENASGVEQMLVSGAMKWLAPFKAVLTELNPGFWPVNFARDIGSLAVQMPHGVRALRNLPRSYMAARATLSGPADPIADQLLQRLMVVSRAGQRGDFLGHPREMTRWLLRMSKYPELWDAETKKIGMVLRAWEAWKRQGQILERTVKAAGMMELDRAFGAEMPEWMKKKLVNELAGSPDFNERGRAVAIVEISGGPMFINAWLRGVEAFYTAQKPGRQANGKRDWKKSAGVWGKFLLFFGLPAIAYYAYEKGLTNFGVDPKKAEDERDMLRSIPERDKLRGFVITLGWQDKKQGKVAYLVLPFPEQVRQLHAALRKLMQSMTGDKGRNQGLESLLRYGGQDLPGANPLWTEGVKWFQFYALGQNPYDSFRGRPSLDDDTFKAGEGAKELAKQSASSLQGGFAYRYRPDVPGDTPTELEKFLALPFVGNVMGRWVRVSNAGIAEQDAKATAPVEQHQAALRLVAHEMMRKVLAKEPYSDSENKLMAAEPYLVTYLMDTLGNYAIHATGPELRDFGRANAEQRIALINSWAERDRQKNVRLKAGETMLPVAPP